MTTTIKPHLAAASGYAALSAALLLWNDPTLDPAWTIPVGWVCVGLALARLGRALGIYAQPMLEQPR